ncbi:unnamed protein product [Pedinophyceae sp. YPF-701]|nr:unnamed protein product [Pedinophyceae sp. YPF-701]
MIASASTFAGAAAPLRAQSRPARATPARGMTVVARAKELGCGIMGTKAGMTTWFTPDGLALPATVIAIEEGNVVTQVKTEETDGYAAVQVSYQPIKEKNVKKPNLGHLKKAGAPPLRRACEFKFDGVEEFELGQKLEVAEMFKEGDLVDIAGTSIGKGFQGSIKRHGMARGLMTHGSKSHRQHGSIGGGHAGEGGRVMPGLKMAGQMGNTRVKVKKLQVLAVDTELGAMVVKGSVPGKAGNVLEIVPAKTG